mgnify:CR=1 FL=1
MAITTHFKQCLPDFRIDNCSLIKQARVVGLLGQESLENVKKGLEVNKFGGVIDIKLG